MLYELSIREMVILQTACAVAQCQMEENAEASERCANDRHLPKAMRASAARVTEWYQTRKDAFKTVRNALDEGREITTLEQVKEALER